MNPLNQSRTQLTAFIENRGQLDGDVRYYVQGRRSLRGVLERRQQAQDVHVHAQRRGERHGECAITFSRRGSRLAGSRFEWAVELRGLQTSGLAAFTNPRAREPRPLKIVNTFQLNPIGRVESTLTALEDAPRQADEGAPAAWLVFAEDVREALANVRPGDRLIVLTWLDRAQRDVLAVHPRGDTSRPREGVFTTRSPHRPNPIGLHSVEVLAVDGVRVQVDHLEALHGTPILDVKPVLAGNVGER